MTLLNQNDQKVGNSFMLERMKIVLGITKYLSSRFDDGRKSFIFEDIRAPTQPKEYVLKFKMADIVAESVLGVEAGKRCFVSLFFLEKISNFGPSNLNRKCAQTEAGKEAHVRTYSRRTNISRTQII